MKKILPFIIMLFSLLVCVMISFNGCAQTNATFQSYRFSTPSGGLGDKIDTTTFVPKPPGTIVWGNTYKHYYVGLDGFFHLLGGSSTGLISGLTSPRIPFAASATSLTDNAGFSFSAGSVNVPNLTDAGLTTTRIPFASTGGLLINSANLAYTGPTGLFVQATSTVNDVAEFLSNGGGCSLCLHEGKAQFSGGTGGREIDIFSGSQMLIQNITNATTQNFIVSGGGGIVANHNGDNLVLKGGDGLAANSGNGGTVSILGGNASTTNGNGANVVISNGIKQGSGTDGNIKVLPLGTGTFQVGSGGPFAVNNLGGINATSTGTDNIITNQSISGSETANFSTSATMTIAADNLIGGGVLNISAGSSIAISAPTVSITGSPFLAQSGRGSATLDFPSTAAGAESTLTINMSAGSCSTGYVVMLGTPIASVTTNVIFWAYVNASNQVTVVCQNTGLVTARDPASGIFTVICIAP